ncbi:hypothetical protein QYF61_005821 [Mycteria americana]|uniref:Integrase catalytic domain-containing protein n=1 Tax=Mycteria americana TaxID=33587 RepID=A0AAN7RIX5_MYCAM|nr:hypothetical protein QYF61_005821 [Mycteria americana]
MDAIAQVIHECETRAAIKQAKRLKPLWYGGRWLKYKYGEAWQMDYITRPQTRQGKRRVLTMVEAITRWLETYPVTHATARNTILGLEKQVLWQHGTPERIESDNGTYFRNNLIDTWAKEHGIEQVYHIPLLLFHVGGDEAATRSPRVIKRDLRALGRLWWAVTPEGTEMPNLLMHGSVAGVIAMDLVFLTTGWPTLHRVCWRLMGFIFLKGERESLLRNLQGSLTEL